MAEQQPNPEQSPAPAASGHSGGASGPTSGGAEESAASSASEALDRAEQAADTLAATAGGAPAEQGGNRPRAIDLPEFSDGARPADDPARIALLGDVNLHVKVELGRTRMYVEDVLRLNADSVIELDKAAGDPVDIYVNDRHVARGEVLVVNDNFCVRVSEIVSLAAQVED